MKQEILDLIDIYENEPKYQDRISDTGQKQPIPDMAEALNLQDKINFGKNRQRAELLKLNEVFLKELSGIKNRLGEEFLKFIEDVDNSFPRDYREDLLKSNFAEPKVVISHSFSDEHGNEGEVFYLPGTRIEGDGFPESEVYEEDSYFKGQPLEWVVVPEYELFNTNIDDPKFRFRCKEKVFIRYISKWFGFLTKWHISHLWNGDLEYLHVHSLPSISIEIDRDNQNLPIRICLGAWATLEDLKREWPNVEKLMKDERIYRERESDNFLRDLIWYQLSKNEAMSPLKIAHFWAKKFPKEIDLEAIEKVTKDEETFEGVPIEERLEEVLSDDPKMAELRGRFIEARNDFIHTGLKDKVRKSIRKTEEKIKRLGSEEWDRNRQRLFKAA
jgi:hypothetical protein